MKTLTLTELLKLLGTTPKQIKLITLTDVKLKKNTVFTNPIKKLSNAIVEVNFDYKTDVNEARKLEGIKEEFTASSRKWGKHIEGSTCLIEHETTKEKYLNCKLISKDKKVEYIDGSKTTNPIPIETIQPYLPAVSPSKTQGVENQIVINTYKLSSIKEIEIDNVKYTFIPTDKI
jgi:hypothetical protein